MMARKKICGIYKIDTSKLVLDVEYGVYYSSIREVCILYGMSSSHLGDKLNGKEYNNTRFTLA